MSHRTLLRGSTHSGPEKPLKMAIFAGHIRYFWIRWVLKPQKMDSPCRKTPNLTLKTSLFDHRERFWPGGGLKIGHFLGFFLQKRPKRGKSTHFSPEKLERSFRGQNRGFWARRVHF